jgi:hypothetical protein
METNPFRWFDGNSMDAWNWEAVRRSNRADHDSRANRKGIPKQGSRYSPQAIPILLGSRPWPATTTRASCAVMSEAKLTADVVQTWLERVRTARP